MAKKRAETLLAAGRGADTAWHGTAFVVEALVLLVFLAFALAVFMQLFGAAHARGMEERQLTQAVLLASNAAEEFAADAAGGTQSAYFDGNGSGSASTAGEGAYHVTSDVTPERTEGGTLYRADIAVILRRKAVYQLETARYVSDGAGSRRCRMTTRGRGSVRIGPISLFALVIILCLAVMAVLSVTTAQATYAAAERQALFTNDTYANERAAQELGGRHRRGSAPCARGGGLDEALAAVRAALPDGARRNGSTVSMTFTPTAGARSPSSWTSPRTPRTAQRMEGDDAVDGERRGRHAWSGAAQTR